MSNPNIESKAKCVKALIECARMCEMSAAEMAANAMFAKDQCRLCADVCAICAKDCEMFKDDYCQRCGEVCRACAQELKNIEDKA
jgi:hypothetical protein